MIEVASVILSIWCGINLLLAVSILVTVGGLGRKAPIVFVVFEEAEIPTLDRKVTAAVNALAVWFNASIAAFCLLALFVVWSAFVHAEEEAFWALLVTVGLVQALSFRADSIIGNRTLYVNIAMSLLYVLGAVLASLALFG